MTLKRFLLKMQPVAHSAVRSPYAVVGVTLAVVGVILASQFTAEFFVISAGLIGVWAGYWYKRPNDDENPRQALRPVWGMSRPIALIGISGLSALVAFGFLLAWTGVLVESDGRNAVYLVGCVGCYAFSASFYLFGRYRLTRARDILKTATAQQIHDWRHTEPMDRKPGLSEIF